MLQLEKQWFTKAGHFAVILRMAAPLNHLCGYVQVDRDLYAEQDCLDIDINCHGGITFNGTHEELPCHWIGFDCAHGSDWTDIHPTGHQWTIEEVMEECESIAKQVTGK